MKVEFQVLQTADVNELLFAVIDFISKQFDAGVRVAVLSPTGLAKQLDQSLWQEGTDSFIPHHCATSSREYNQYKNIPILITDNLFITSGFDVLVNIMDVAVDPQRVKVKELKEFVYQEEQALLSSRKKYVYYKKHNLDINTSKK